jgi:iron-sulfur cluster insertion protein
MTQLNVTPNAAKRVLELIAKRKDATSNQNFMLRVTVLGGGCSGFQYKIGLDTQINEDDKVYEMHGIKLVVDDTSMGFLDGVILDYVEELIGASFQIKNPNASSSCGCGNSFSV